MLMAAVGSMGTCRSVSWFARSGGTVVNVFVSLFHDTLPVLKAWVATSPS
jgi:hypothetical protein